MEISTQLNNLTEMFAEAGATKVWAIFEMGGVVGNQAMDYSDPLLTDIVFSFQEADHKVGDQERKYNHKRFYQSFRVK